jgi:hypothetical protein
MYTDFHPLCSDVVRSKQRTGLDNMNDVSNVGGNVLPDDDFSIPTAAELAAPEAAVPAGPNGFELLGLAPELVQAVRRHGLHRAHSGSKRNDSQGARAARLTACTPT